MQPVPVRQQTVLKGQGTLNNDDDLERAMEDVPRGAFALAALTVGLVLGAWLVVYFFVFLPRGMVS